VKKRWKILGGVFAVALVAAAAPIVYVETSCGGPVEGFETGGYEPLVAGEGTRPEGRTWLTYPEWHIVYSADSYGRHLVASKPPSAYPFMADVGAFWGSVCQLNRVAGETEAAGAVKTMIYTIGISFSAEMLVKSVWENTLGRLFEETSGWTSADDRHAARVQVDYGRFMHETPWYRFPFGRAFSDLWRTSEPVQGGRHWERRIALSLEYGAKAVYAKLIGWASGETLGADETRMRLLVRGERADIETAGEDLAVVEERDDALLIEVPRYERFTTFIGRLARSEAGIVEIAGNDDVFVTFQATAAGQASLPRGIRLVDMRLGDRPGWRRIGVTVKARELLPAIRVLAPGQVELEHVYDY
jgi:hypothetical protein